jgi:hypothetical protein
MNQFEVDPATFRQAGGRELRRVGSMLDTAGGWG